VPEIGLQHLGFVQLPSHLKTGGFDHAAVHEKSGTLYVAHTANDAVDIIDCEEDRYLRSIHGLTGVAGVLVSNDHDLVFTSNRGEKTVGFFPHGNEDKLVKISVGGFPNGLAYDPSKGHLLAANVSKVDDPHLSPINSTLTFPNLHRSSQSVLRTLSESCRATISPPPVRMDSTLT